MSRPDGMVSCGAAFYYSDAPPLSPNWLELGWVIDMNVDGITVTATEVSHLRSQFCAKEFLPGKLDGGTLTLNTNFVATQYVILNALLQNYKAFRIITPNISTMTFEGFITSLGVAIPDDDRITVPITIKVSGRPTFLLQN